MSMGEEVSKILTTHSFAQMKAEILSFHYVLNQLFYIEADLKVILRSMPDPVLKSLVLLNPSTCMGEPAYVPPNPRYGQ